MIHAFVGRAVDWSFCGELQWVKDSVSPDTERAAQLQEGVADPTGAIVHQLGKKRNKNINMSSIKEVEEKITCRSEPPELLLQSIYSLSRWL